MEASPPPLSSARTPYASAPPPWRVVIAVVAILAGALITDILIWRSSIRREVAQQRIILVRVAATMAAPALARDEGETGLENRYLWALGIVAPERRLKAKQLEEDLATFGDRIWGEVENTAYDRALRAMAHRRMLTALEEALNAASRLDEPTLQRRAALMLAGQLLASDALPERLGQTPETLFRAALATCDREIEPRAWAEAQGYLAEALRLRRQNEEARRLAEEAIVLREKTVGPTDPTLQRWLVGRALAAAEPADRYEWLRRAIPMQNTGGVLTVRELQRLGQDCGRILFDGGNYASAQLFLRESISFGEKAGAAGMLDLGKALSDLGTIYMRERRAEEAEPLLQRALALIEVAVGPQHDETMRPLLGLSGLKLFRQDWPAAERYGRQALQIALRSQAPDRGEFIFVAFGVLTEAVRLQDRPQEVEQLYHQGVAALDANFGPDYPHTAALLKKLADFLNRQHRFTEAERMIRRVVATEERLFSPEDPRRAGALGTLGNILAFAGRPVEAEPLLLRAHSLYAREAKPDFLRQALILQDLAAVYLTMDLKHNAEPMYLKALAALAQAQGPSPEPPPQAKEIVENYAKALVSMGVQTSNAKTRAEEAWREALQAARKPAAK